MSGYEGLWGYLVLLLVGFLPADVWRLLGRPGTLPVTVHLLGPLDRSGDRKQLTLEAREAIAQTLGFKLADQSPIGRGE